MPPDLLPYLPFAITAALSAALAWLITFLVTRSSRARLQERLKFEERRQVDLEARLAIAGQEAQQADANAASYRNKLTELNSRYVASCQAADEKQALLENAEEKLTETFKALSADALQGVSAQFLQLAKATLSQQTEQAKGDIEQRQAAIATLVRPMADSLGKFELRIGEIERMREGAYSELKEQIRALGLTQSDLRSETAALVKALRQPAGRGQWGEIQLRRVVELAGMQEHCDFTTQSTVRDEDGKSLRPDMLVTLPGSKTIVIDSKTPMDAYLNALESKDDTARRQFLRKHAAQVQTHISQLSSKNYTSQFSQTPEFTVLFLPSEALFSAALQADPGLIERGAAANVILANPSTLIALLKIVAYGWQQETLAINTKQIADLGRQMHARLQTLTGHFSKLGSSLNSAVDQYNNAIGSYEDRVLKTARRFEDLGIAKADEQIPVLPEISRDARETPANKTNAAHNAAEDLRNSIKPFGD